MNVIEQASYIGTNLLLRTCTHTSHVFKVLDGVNLYRQ